MTDTEDIEAIVFDYVSRMAKAEFEGLRTSSWPYAEPEGFPFLLVRQVAGYDAARTIDSGHSSEAVRVAFEASAYSDSPATRKADARAISIYVGKLFKTLGFTEVRMGGGPVDLIDPRGRAVACYDSRYEAEYGPDGLFHTF